MGLTKTEITHLKKATRIQQHRQRSEEWRQVQIEANRLRKEFGYIDADPRKVIERHKAATAEVTRQQRAEADARSVEAILATPKVGRTIRNWLALRVHRPPTHVKGLIERFLSREGNEKIRDAVHAHLVSEGCREIAMMTPEQVELLLLSLRLKRAA